MAEGQGSKARALFERRGPYTQKKSLPVPKQEGCDALGMCPELGAAGIIDRTREGERSRDSKLGSQGATAGSGEHTCLPLVTPDTV